MILTFSKDIFVERIISGIKIHTIREDKHNRWKVGNSIQFWRGNPRNVRNNPYQFGEGICQEVKPIKIDPINNEITIFYNKHISEDIGLIDSLNEIAKNDGFDSWEQMKEWFKEPFVGKIIYWTQFKKFDI